MDQLTVGVLFILRQRVPSLFYASEYKGEKRLRGEVGKILI